MSTLIRETVFLWIELRKRRSGKNKESRLVLGSVASMTSSLSFDESYVGTLLYLLRNSPCVVCYSVGDVFKVLEKYNNYAPLHESLKYVNVMKAIEANCDFRPFFFQTIENTLKREVEPDVVVGDLMRLGGLTKAVALSEARALALRDLYLFISTNGFATTQHKDGGHVRKVKVPGDYLKSNYFVI